MRFLVFPMAVMICGLSISALAKDKYSSEYSSCNKRAVDTASLRDCNGEEIQRQNARLNEAYKWALGVLSEENRKALQKSQALWAELRDIDCDLYYGLTGGTMDLLNGSGCYLEMTRERAESLEFIADNGGEIGGE
ncbi:lysozyme inhibitor LprI family protein [Pseudomonas palmensis]|uniref:lysozyme inhibitor LprI family protein n=1 Tax=Pseudomonas palmensis TaxID=2815362 RepID=UPI0039E7580F